MTRTWRATDTSFMRARPRTPGHGKALLQIIGPIEKFHVQIPHADQLRQMWTEWLVEQERLRKERGW
jgi:hypothetical protein